jgi:S1-C subfamily serine protease
VVTDLLRTGRATHAFFGIQPVQVTRDVAAQLGLDQAAGVQPGDVLTKLDDKPLTTVEDLFGELRQHHPGDKVNITLIRNGREQQVTATLADNPTG